MSFLKISFSKFLFALSLFLLSANLAFASSFAHGGAHSTPEIGSLFWPTCNFVLYLILMVFLYRKFARPVLRDQRIELEAFVARAQNEMTTLLSEASQLKERLAMIQEEKAEIVADLEKEGRLLADSIISQANEKARRLKQDSDKWYSAEIQRTKSDAKKELVRRIISKVKADLKVGFSSEEDRQFIKSSLVGLPQSQKNS